MNTPELESILKKARTPELSEESKETFVRRVVSRLGREEPARRLAQNFWPRLGWAAGLAACAVIVIAIGQWSGRTKSGPVLTADSLASVKVVRELMAMFPNQVRAIVEDDHGVNVVLANGGGVPASAPLYVHICDGKHCSSVVTFSGQEISVGGQELTVLSDTHGGIILEGDHFVWSSTGDSSADRHFRIEAKTLAPATM